MINYDIHKGKNKKGKGSNWSLHILLTATFVLMWNFLAHYNFDLRFHTSAETYYIPKGMNEIHELLMCLGYVWKRNVVCSLMLYNKIQRSRGSTSQSDFSLTILGLTGIDFEPRQEKTGRKTSWRKGLRREAITTQPTYGAATTPVFEPCLHLWEASALTTAYPSPPLSVVNRPLR